MSSYQFLKAVTNPEQRATRLRDVRRFSVRRLRTVDGHAERRIAVEQVLHVERQAEQPPRRQLEILADPDAQIIARRKFEIAARLRDHRDVALAQTANRDRTSVWTPALKHFPNGELEAPWKLDSARDAD